MIMEEWKKIVGWPKYDVSNLGNVRRNNNKIKSFLNNHGYPSFNVIDRNFRKMLRVHREVAKCFVEPFQGILVRHLDGDKKNCDSSNLAWGDHFQNELDKKNHGKSLMGEGHHRHKLTNDEVLIIRSSLEKRGILAIMFNVNPVTIWNIKTRRSWRHL